MVERVGKVFSQEFFSFRKNIRGISKARRPFDFDCLVFAGERSERVWTRNMKILDLISIAQSFICPTYSEIWNLSKSRNIKGKFSNIIYQLLKLRIKFFNSIVEKQLFLFKIYKQIMN